MRLYLPAPFSRFAARQQPNLLLITLAFLALLLPTLSLTERVMRVQPQVLQLAKQSPDQPVSLIIQKNSADPSVEKQVVALGGIITRELPIINAFVTKVPARQSEVIGLLPAVRWVSYDAPVNKTSTNCTGCISSANLQNVYEISTNASQVWNNTTNTGPWLQGQNIGIAVVDSGVNPNVKDFSIPGAPGWTRVSVNANFNSNTKNVGDGYGHGTLVAGVIAGNGFYSNGGYIGIAPAADIISVKVSDDTGSSTASDVVSGLQWILKNKSRYNIRVVNLSLNSSLAQSYNVDPIDAAVEILWFNGIVVVVSAGNNGNTTTNSASAPILYPPANDPFVITVGAVNDGKTADLTDDNVTPFSAYNVDETGNVKPDLVAPGRNIVSTIPTSQIEILKEHPGFMVGNYYMRVSGTSFAAPQVAGAAALLLQSEPNLNPDQVKYRLKATALQNYPRASWDTRPAWQGYTAKKAGAGYLDIQAAIAHSEITNTANTGYAASKLLWTGNSPVNWSSVNWSSVNWSSVNWSSVNWSSVNWSSVNWSSDFWDK